MLIDENEPEVHKEIKMFQHVYGGEEVVGPQLKFHDISNIVADEIEMDIFEDEVLNLKDSDAAPEFRESILEARLGNVAKAGNLHDTELGSFCVVNDRSYC